MAKRQPLTKKQVAATVPGSMKRRLPPHAQRIWASAFANAKKQYGMANGAPYRVANAAVENKYHGPGQKHWRSGKTSMTSHPAAKRGT